MLPIKLERRLSRLHIRFYGLYKWRLAPAIAVFLGFGISYMPANAKWRYTGDSVELDYKIPKQVVQQRLDGFIRTIKRARSLEIRTHDSLDYGAIKSLRKLRHLSITGPVSQVIDLSTNSYLRTIAGNSSTMSKIQGLSDLQYLREVHANRVSITWLRSLPVSVKYLFLTGPLQDNLDLASMPNLKALGFNQTKLIDLSRISKQSMEVTELLLSQVKQIENVDQLPFLFPNLQIVTFEEVAKSVRMEISNRFSGNYRFIEK
jgi:hypothetical protein